MGNFLSRTDLLKKDVLQIEKVEFEGDGDFVFVRAMTGHEGDTFQQSLLKKVKDAKGIITHEQDTVDFRAKLAVNTVCDEAGVLVFVPNDYRALSNNISAKKLEQIANVAQRLNGMTEEAKEEMVKNSEADQPGNSSSNSVKN